MTPSPAQSWGLGVQPLLQGMFNRSLRLALVLPPGMVQDAGPAVPQEGAALSPLNPRKVLRARGHQDPFSCLTAMSTLPLVRFFW